LIAYLEGKLTFKSPTSVHLDIGGIAYVVKISLNTYGQIEHEESTKLYTQLIIRENEHSLFGFKEMKEKDLFSKLVTVKGIGPNTARVILSYLTPEETHNAILHENVAAFKKVKGVGPKTAQQIILDLKNKIAKATLETGGVNIADSAPNSIREEAISALMALGFQRAPIGKVVDKVMGENPEMDQVENLIKTILRQL